MPRQTRTLRLLERPGTTPGLLAFLQPGGKFSVYWLIVAPGGNVVELRQAGAAHGYTVTRRGQGRWSCTCPGYRFGGKCKHSAAVGVLDARGLLTPPTQRP